MGLPVQVSGDDQLSWVVSSEGRCGKDEVGGTIVMTSVWQGFRSPLRLWVSDVLSLVGKRHHLECWQQNGREVG